MLNAYQQVMRLIYRHDSLTFLHIKRVAVLMERFASYMGLTSEECYIAKLGGFLHDIGKLELAPEVLHKRGKLTEKEIKHIKKHPVLGYHILKHYHIDKRIVEMTRWHHERFDGGGYPDKLRGTEAPLLCRMMAIVDAWEAMTGKRLYRSPLSHEKALAELQNGKGTQFDPELVEHFVAMISSMHVRFPKRSAASSVPLTIPKP